MSRTVIKVGAVLGADGQINSAKSTVNSASNSFSRTASAIDSKIKSRSNIRSRLSSTQRSLSQIEADIANIRSTVNRSANLYSSTEDRVYNWSRGISDVVVNKGAVISGLMMQFKEGLSEAVEDIHEFINKGTDGVDGVKHTADAKVDPEEVDELSGFAKFINNKLKADGSVLEGELGGETEILGIDTAGKIGGSILTGEVGIKNSMEWKFKDDEGNFNFNEFGMTTEAYATGALAKGNVEGNIGYLHGKAEGKFITGAVKGEAKCTLFEDGELRPTISVGGKAEVSVLQGEAEVGFGTDQYGVFAKAEGDVLHAEAEAKAGIGRIGTDEKGNAIYGAAAEASAMASVAQGKVKGGITVFGIDIDVGLKGYAVAAGVEAGGSISTDGVRANFSGALGLGAGLDISVDWSDAEWIGESIDAVGNAIDTAGDFVVDTLDTAGKAVNDAIDYVGEKAGEFYDAASDVVSNTAESIGQVANDVGDFLFGWLPT